MHLWIGPISGFGGYAEEGRSLRLALEKALGDRVHGIDIDQPDTVAQIGNVERLILSDVDPKVGDIHVYHRYWPERPESTVPTNIWRTMFETSSLPAEWVAAAELYDFIWVPSRFNLESFSRAGIPRDKIRIVHCPIPTWSHELIDSISIRCESRCRGKCVSRGDMFRFVSVMRWQRRKGWDVLLAAYSTQFDESSEVSLTIRASPFDSRDPHRPVRDLTEFYHSRRKAVPRNVELLMSRMTTKQIANLYSSADCFVLPSRGEGWGRPYMEALLAGVPIIAPRWSGCLEFTNETNAFYFDGELTPTGKMAAAEWAYFKDQHWLEPSLGSVCKAMALAVAGEPWKCAERFSVARQVEAQFSCTAIGGQISEVLTQDGVIAT
jgi:glycosyltransferase involved in cell wall biosynthesis